MCFFGKYKDIKKKSNNVPKFIFILFIKRELKNIIDSTFRDIL